MECVAASRFIGGALAVALGIGSVAGCKGPAGAAGEPGVGTPGDEGEKGAQGLPIESEGSISVVTPLQVFLDRVKQVSISGVATAWTDDTVVDFGEDIEVLDITVASPTSLTATIRVPQDAAMGGRPIVVREDGRETIFGGNVFEVLSPLRITFFGGAEPEQGSVTGMFVEMLDLTTPFSGDNNGNLDTFFGVEPVRAFMMRGGEDVGVEALVVDETPYSAGVFLYVDVDELAGPMDLRIESLDPFLAIDSFLPGAFTIVERVPTVITPPTYSQPALGGEGFLFTFNTTSAAEMLITLAPDEQQTIPLVSVLAGSGKFEDALPSNFDIGPWVLPYEFPNQVSFVSPQADTFYLVTQNNIVNAIPHNLDIGVNIHPVTVTAVVPPALEPGAIAIPGDAAYYTFESQAGQAFFATVVDGMTSTCATDLDSFMQLYSDQGLQLFGEHDDNDPGAPDWCSTMQGDLPYAGTYYLRVSGSAFCGGCTFDYQLFIDLP